MEIAECPICWEDPVNFKKLSCKHAFCENCLKKCLDQCDVIFSCPICRKTFQVEKTQKTKFIEDLPTISNAYCLTCKKKVFAECVINEHDQCDLNLSSEIQNKLCNMIQQEIDTQEKKFEEYCKWSQKQKEVSLSTVKDFVSNLISEISNWRENIYEAIEMNFHKDLENLKKMNESFLNHMKVKKSSIIVDPSNFHNNVFPESKKVDFSNRKILFPNSDALFAALKPGEILAPLLDKTRHLYQAVEEFKNSPEALQEFSVGSKEKESVVVHPPVYSAMETTAEKTSYECISDFELVSGICRAKILPNDTIITCCDNPNKLEMYNVNGGLLSVTKLADIPEDIIVWKDNRLIVYHQNLSFQLVTYENNHLIAQGILDSPQNYDSISFLGPDNLLCKYDRNKCDILKIETSEFATVSTYFLSLSKVNRVYGGAEGHVWYSGTNTRQIPDEIFCYNPKTKRDIKVFPVSSNLTSNNIRDFTVKSQFLFILDYLDHKVYIVDLLKKSCSVLLTEKDGIQKPFCIDINESGHLLVCYNKNKIKVFNIAQAMAALN